MNKNSFKYFLISLIFLFALLFIFFFTRFEVDKGVEVGMKSGASAAYLTLNQNASNIHEFNQTDLHFLLDAFDIVLLGWEWDQDYKPGGLYRLPCSSAVETLPCIVGALKYLTEMKPDFASLHYLHCSSFRNCKEMIGIDRVECSASSTHNCGLDNVIIYKSYWEKFSQV